jgi:hypothetical protein
MAYWLDSLPRFRSEVFLALTSHFGDKAIVNIDNHGISVHIKPDAGFKKKEERLTQEQLAQGVCGGGIIEAIDGMSFSISVQES